MDLYLFDYVKTLDARDLWFRRPALSLVTDALDVWITHFTSRNA